MAKVYQFPIRQLPVPEPASEPARDEVVHAAIRRFAGRCIPILDRLVHEQGWSRSEAQAKLIAAVADDWRLSWWAHEGRDGTRMVDEAEVMARPEIIEVCFIGGVLF